MTRSFAAVIAAACVAAGCGGSHAGGPQGSSDIGAFPATMSFRATSALSLAPLPEVRSMVEGNLDDYNVTTRAIGLTSRTCFSSGGWRERVPAAGGGTTTLDLTDPQFHRVLAPFLQLRPGLAIGLAELHRPPKPPPATWRTSFSEPPAELVALAGRLAPPALRAGARAATAWAAHTARAPIRVTAWWSSAQPRLPRRVRLVLTGRSGVGDETDILAWSFRVPGPSVTHC
ncbi:MAG TPA: hypothetical protein VGL44_06460 [Gaiellales bacterium]